MTLPRRDLLLAGAGALLTVGAAGAAATTILPRAAFAAPGPRRSGMPWNTGMYNPARSVADFEADEAWFGRKIDFFPEFWGQEDTVGALKSKSSIMQSRMASFMGKNIAIWLAVPLLAGNDRGLFGRCDDADYQSYFETVGRTVAEAHPATYDGRDIWYRVGWEMNGGTFPWSAQEGSGPAGFKAAYNAACAAIKRTDPSAKFMLNFLKGSPIPASELFPNDDTYVQVIGIDYYDNRDGGTLWQTGRSNSQEETFESAANKGTPTDPIGIRRWRDFAISKGKGFAVPEWGLTNIRPTGEATVPYTPKEEWPPIEPNRSPQRPWTDRTHFIEGMHAFFVDSQGLMGENFRGEGYFNRLLKHQLNPSPETRVAYNGFNWNYHERSRNRYRTLFQPTA